jgi:hypothetical protein
MDAGWANKDSGESTHAQHTSATPPPQGRQALNSSQISSSVPMDDIRELESNAIEKSVTNALASSSASPNQPESEKLEKLYTGGKTAITRAKGDVLAQLHSYLTGATFEDSSRLTRDHLKEIIFAMVSFQINSRLIVIFISMHSVFQIRLK